ncbi:MAG: glycosyltransferase family 39 protein [Saprospirales bacterium]|nr:glycosyltransferase family 39 protein [Saprospirales bacterium]
MRFLSALDPHSAWLIRVFFLGYLLLGLWITPDYGVSWDEPIQRRHGIVTTDYINRFFGIEAERFDPEFELETYEHRYYGVLFTTICFKLERMLGLETWRQQHLLRHYAVFLSFWLGTIGFYLLLRYRFSNWKWILAGLLFLLLCPRIFGHSFFNVKDAVLISAVLWAMYTMVRFLDTPRWTWALAHGFASAIAIDVRIVAVVIPALTVGWWVIRLLAVRPSFPKAIVPIGVYGLVTALITVAGWPYLWENPAGNLLEAYRVMGHYQWGGEVRLWGEFYTRQVDCPGITCPPGC